MEFNKLCCNMIKKFPKLYTYYNDNAELASIPLNEYNESDVLKDEVFELLKEKHFLYKGKEYNWVIEYGSLSVNKSRVDGINIRVAESY